MLPTQTSKRLFDPRIFRILQGCTSGIQSRPVPFTGNLILKVSGKCRAAYKTANQATARAPTCTAASPA